jgi:hypothetical protein
MIIDFETKETINRFVNEYVPEGIHELFHIECREQTANIIEVLIEKDIIKNDVNSIEAVCLVWESFMEKKFSLLN